MPKINMYFFNLVGSNTGIGDDLKSEMHEKCSQYLNRAEVLSEELKSAKKTNLRF